jgi:hypothetical protein
VYKLEKGSRRWRTLPPMLKPISHIEFAWVTFNHSIVIVGGSTVNNPVTRKMVLLGDIFLFDTQSKVCDSLFFFFSRTFLFMLLSFYFQNAN